MHIAINGWFWNQENTGSGQYIRRLVPMLKRVAGDTARFSLIMPPHNPQPDNVPEGVNVIATGNKAKTGKFGKVWFEQRTVPRIAQEIGADVLHVPYWGSPLSSAVPVVVSVLDVIPKIMPEYAMGFFNRLYTEMVSTSTQNASHVLTISYTSQIDIEEYLGIPQERITVTYLAPDSEYHPQIGRERDEAVRQKYNLPDEFVLYLGGFDRRKQVNELMLAYTYVGEAEGDNIPLVIAGREPQWREPLFPDMRAYAKRLDIEDYVQWIGYVDEADKPSLYRLAKVFAFPSEYEGFGLTPLEAMACGTPTVTFNEPIFDEILEEGAYLVEDSRQMAGALIALLIQPPFHEAMKNQGLAQVTKYNWRKTAKGTLEAYQKVVGS
jgi:glycosyltransferase involved in cell wall biosynthesis